MTKTPLAELERSIVTKLAGCTFPPATASKRLVRDLSSGRIQNLSKRGREFLAYVAHRFRRQWAPTAEEWSWVLANLERPQPPRAEIPNPDEWVGRGVVDSAHSGSGVTQFPISRRSRREELAHPAKSAPAQMSLF